MSGICGTIRLDGRPADKTEIAPVLDAMAARGPDGEGSWSEGAAVLGQRWLRTTPEAVLGPIVHQPTGCAITASARIDNRDELVPLLCPDRPAIDDGELILLAYLRWDRKCLERLLGDFAFAIWDPREQRLFAARDPMGMAPLAYHFAPGRLFVFASEARQVIAHAEVPETLNEARIADQLLGLEQFSDSETFWLNVWRLPAAHCLSLQNGSHDLRRYCRFEPRPELKFDSDDEYAEAISETLDRAVAARLRSVGPVGAMLSGGLDSASVCALAACRLVENGSGPLLTFSMVSAQADCAETQAIHAASAAIHGIDPHLCDLAMLGPPKLESACWDDPFDGHMVLAREMYRKASGEGVRVVLDGLSGDSSFGPIDHIANLLRRGRFGAALREHRGERRFWGEFAEGSLIRHAWQAVVSSRLRFHLRELRTQRAGTDRNVAPLSRDMALRIDVPARHRAVRREAASWQGLGRSQRGAMLNHGWPALARERLDRIGAKFGVEARDPFADLRLLELGLSLPLDQIQRFGFGKYGLRRAMGELLPDAVLWRTGKPHLGWEASLAAIPRPSQLPRQIQDLASPYIDWASIDEPDERRDGRGGNDLWLRGVSLACWLAAPALNKGSKLKGLCE